MKSILALLFVCLGNPSVYAAAITGTVSQAGGGEVAGARVVAYSALPPAQERLRATAAEKPAPLASATTNEHGAFTLDPRTAGVVEIMVERDGFVPATEYARAGETAHFELTPAAKRTGRVTAAGKPVAGAAIVVTNGRSVLWSTQTAADGTYALADPKGWAAHVAIVHRDYAPHVIDVTKGKASLDAALVAGTDIAGRVMRGDRAVANAHVIAGHWKTATTGEDGTFILRHVASTVDSVEAYEATRFGSAKRTAEPLVVQLEEGRGISGSVRDAEKRPVGGTPVTAYPASRRGESRWRDAYMTVTDEKGNYRFEHFESGDYMVIPYGAATLDFESETVSLRSDTAGRADFIASQKEYVTGRVIDEEKRPIAGAIVQYAVPQMPLAYALAADQSYTVRSDAEGRFRLPVAEVPAGMELRVFALRNGFALTVSEALAKDRTVAPIVMKSGIALSGVVVDGDGKPLANAGIAAIENPSGTMPLPLDSALASGAVLPFIRTDDAGRFSLRLNDSAHDVAVWKEGFAGSRQANVRPGGDPLKIVLEAGAEIRGRVTRKAGPPVTSGTVMARGEDGSFVQTEVTVDGTFVLASVRPGSYTLQFEQQGSSQKQITAPASDVVLELAATGTIRGRVVDAATGKTVTTYDVMADLSEGMEMESVENEQSFTMNVPGGPVELRISASGYVDGVRELEVTAGKTAELTIALTPGRTAFGVVTDDAGAGVGGAMLNVEDGPGITRSEDNGEYRLDSLPRGAVTITVSANGLVEKKVELPAGDTDVRQDVVLARGRKAAGRVVASDGTPVAGATVTAMGRSSQTTESAADGRFTLTGLDAGAYIVSATRDELASDPFPLGDDELLVTMKPSAGAGAIHGSVKGFTGGAWMFGYVTANDDSTRATIGRDGKFRFDRIAAGEVELRGWAMSTRAEASTAPARVTVIANGEVEVNLAFRDDVTIRGTVSENGTPAVGRKLTFTSGAGRWRTTTTEGGQYALTGLEPGAQYAVEVSGAGRDYETSYHVAASATFDIAIEWSQVEGRVLDDAGAPMAGAEVEVRGNSEERKTDANGTFAVPAARGAHVLTVKSSGFATVTQRVDAGTPVVVRMRRTNGLRVRLTDARDGHTLDGYAVAIDEAGLQIAKSSEAQKDGAMLLPIAAGTYRIAVSADGFASQSTRGSVPQQGELRFALTPGGTLVVRTGRSTSDLVRLILPSGEEYVRCHCNGIAEIRLTGGVTTVEHVAPGTYTMQVLDPKGLIKTSQPITIAEGQTTTVEINVPE